MSDTIKLMALRIGLLLAVLAIWESCARSGIVDPAFAGEPSGIISSLYNGLFVQGDFGRELGWTVTSTILAFTLGSAAGILVGLLFVFFPALERVSEPLLAALNAMPRIALAPMLIVWFGLGMGSKVAIGFSLTFFIVLQSTVAGGRGVNPDHATLSRTIGLSPASFFWHITMPSAVPVMFSGLRIGLVAALLGVVGGEIIASTRGLGQRVAYLASAFDMNGVWAVLFLLAIVGMILSWGLDRLEAYLLRWR